MGEPADVVAYLDDRATPQADTLGLARLDRLVDEAMLRLHFEEREFDQLAALDHRHATLDPLCRRHHRLKTHSGWRYFALEPGAWIWTEPHGMRFLTNHRGTRDVTPASRRSALVSAPCLD